MGRLRAASLDSVGGNHAVLQTGQPLFAPLEDFGSLAGEGSERKLDFDVLLNLIAHLRRSSAERNRRAWRRCFIFRDGDWRKRRLRRGDAAQQAGQYCAQQTRQSVDNY